MTKQAVILATEDRKIRLRSIPVEGEWLFWEKIMRGWFTLRLLYIGLRQKLRLPIDERYALPLSPYIKEKYTPEEVKERTNMHHRIDTSTALYKSKAKQDNIKNMTNYTVLIIVCAVALVFLLIAILLVSKTCSFGGTEAVWVP